MNILILIVSVIFGFALACFIFAWILSKSNDIGNSTGTAEDFKTDVSFDVSKNQLEIDYSKRDEVDTFIRQNYKIIASDANEPAPDKLVEQLPGKQIELEDITAIYVDG